MSMVIERVQEKLASPDAKKVDLEKVPLSRAMRRETWSDHARAEYSALEQSLVKGTLPQRTYGELMAQTWFVYVALEEKAKELKDDPVAGPVITDALNRADLAAADVEFYLGSDWRDTVKPLPVVEEYVDRIRNATPAQYVAHHYTRYLADLSGGLMIARSIEQAYKLETDGRRVYVFNEIPDPDAFKVDYRITLDNLPADVDTKRSIIDEVMVAYEYNIELIKEISDRFPVT